MYSEPLFRIACASLTPLVVAAPVAWLLPPLRHWIGEVGPVAVVLLCGLSHLLVYAIARRRRIRLEGQLGLLAAGAVLVGYAVYAKSTAPAGYVLAPIAQPLFSLPASILCAEFFALMVWLPGCFGLLRRSAPAADTMGESLPAHQRARFGTDAWLPVTAGFAGGLLAWPSAALVLAANASHGSAALAMAAAGLTVCGVAYFSRQRPTSGWRRVLPGLLPGGAMLVVLWLEHGLPNQVLLHDFVFKRLADALAIEAGARLLLLGLAPPLFGAIVTVGLLMYSVMLFLPPVLPLLLQAVWRRRRNSLGGQSLTAVSEHAPLDQLGEQRDAGQRQQGEGQQ